MLSPELYCTRRVLLAAGRTGSFYRPKTRRSFTSSLVALLLQMAGIHQNPGPSIKCGLINARSIVLGGALFQDMITSHELDMLAVTESWIVNDDPNAIKLDSVPSGYCVTHKPRP